MSKHYSRSFAGGEIAESLFGRLDLSKFQTGLAKCLNFIVTPQGPIENRAGFEYVLRTKYTSGAVLIPFSYNAEQSFALEVGAGYIRFHAQGATLLETGKNLTAITQASPGVFTSAGHGFSAGDWLFLAGIGGMTQLNGRWGIVATVPTADTFTLTDLFGAAISTASLSAYTSGGTASRVYEISTPYTADHLFDLHYVQSADVLTITHQGYATRELRRLGATSWTLTEVSFIPSLSTPGAPTATAGGPGGGTAASHSYVMTAVAAETLEESLASGVASASADLTVSGNYIDVQPAVVASAVRYNVYKLRSGIYGYIGQSDGSTFRDENIEPDMSKTPPLAGNPFAEGSVTSVDVTNGGSGYGSTLTGGQILTVTVTAPGSGYTSATVSVSGGSGSGAVLTATIPPLSDYIASITIDDPGSLYSSPTVTITGDGTGATATATASAITAGPVTMQVTGSTGSGATVEPVLVGQVITGVRVLTPGANYTNAVASVVSASGGSGAAFTVNLSENTAPQAVSYFEQRRCFGGSSNKPQHVWATRSGTESNMTYSIPTQDDDAITARIVAREANVVRHLVPLNDLIALTSGGVWRLSPASEEPLTPASVSPKQHSGVGASMVQPMITSYSVIYVPDRGSHVRELAYKWETQRYHSDDVAVLAPHLFDYKTIRQLAYSRAPTQILWAVRTDGVLLGLTHQPEHEIKAWHQHTTDGTFESVCAIAEGDEDGVYVIAERSINGQTVQYIERMHSRQFDALEDAFFVDSGLTYDGAAATNITGLWHLEGEEVAILADGGVEEAQTVTDGAITLSTAASVVHVGLAYTADAKTMPLSMEAEAFGQGVLKNGSKVDIRVKQSSGIKAGPDFDNLTEYAQRMDEDYGDAPALVDGMISMVISPQWQADGSVCIRQADPLPLTILSLTLDVARGG